MFLADNGSVDAKDLPRGLAEEFTNHSGSLRRMSLL
jgi:hypothetical protein